MVLLAQLMVGKKEAKCGGFCCRSKKDKSDWRMRVSIPLPTACEAVALPCELIPLYIKIYTNVPSTHQNRHFYSMKLHNTHLRCTKHMLTTLQHQQTLRIRQSTHSNPTFIPSLQVLENCFFRRRLEPLYIRRPFVSHILRIY